MCGRPLQRVIYKYRNISSDVDSYIVEPPCSAHPTYSFSLKNIYEQQIVHKYVWGDLATRGRVRIFTALNKNKGYERIR
jgi:hypothetical protein